MVNMNWNGGSAVVSRDSDLTVGNSRGNEGACPAQSSLQIEGTAQRVRCGNDRKVVIENDVGRNRIGVSIEFPQVGEVSSSPHVKNQITGRTLSNLVIEESIIAAGVAQNQNAQSSIADTIQGNRLIRTDVPFNHRNLPSPIWNRAEQPPAGQAPGTSVVVVPVAELLCSSSRRSNHQPQGQKWEDTMAKRFFRDRDEAHKSLDHEF